MIGKQLVLDASRVVYGYCIKTPLYRDFHLSGVTGMDVYLKMELYQPVHSFKIRGASNKISRIQGGEIITASSGNHGIAVAYMASVLGKKAIIALPEDVNPSKLQMIRDMGAEVVFCGTTSDERISYVKKRAEQEGIPLIPSFDDGEIIGGQGTIGLEIQEQHPVDAILCPVGGGGLLSGIALSYDGVAGTALFGVQAEGAQSMNLSLKAGRPVTSKSLTVADGIMVSTPGSLNVTILGGRLKGMLLVNDDEIVSAAKEMWTASHVLMEPASASTVAALKKHAKTLNASGIRSAALIITGGNVSDAVLRRIAEG